MIKGMICPVSNEKINERTTRLNAFFAMVFIVAGLAFQLAVFPAVLMADFFIRAFTRSRFSPVSLASSLLVNTLGLEEKSIDKAPKIFAARLGFIMTLVISLLFLFGFPVAASVISVMLLILASLEFFFGICVGCMIYTWVVLPFYK